LFSPLTKEIRDKARHLNFHSERIVVDHIRTATFMIADGVLPANTDRGYILRRLIRRAVRHADKLGLPEQFLQRLVPIISRIYIEVYKELIIKEKIVVSEISDEENKFRKTLDSGMKQFEKMISIINLADKNKKISGKNIFLLFSTYGFPFELTKELAQERSFDVDIEGFQEEMDKHKQLSRSGAEQKFKGGMGGTGEMETKYHTATHLLRQALQGILGQEINQKGSNITSERLRFDFSFSRKMTDEEKQKVEELVNEKIVAKLPVNKIIMNKEEAEKTGASHVFGDKYGDEVSIYYIGDSLDSAYSKEFCGGPHVTNTGELGHFKIVKEEAVSAGVRRIKAILD
jgi:alanyl-tRNA synthetase